MVNGFKQFLNDLLPGREKAKAARKSAEPVEYKGYTIQPAPRRQGTQWLTAGIIKKQGPDGEMETEFVRSDTFGSLENANECAIAKARLIIDQRGDKLFEGESP